jgi:hypothetical protein
MACCCWVLNRWWLDWPLVCRCLLGMAGMKPQRLRLTARQQHSQRPVTTLRPPSTTPPMFQIVIRKHKLSRVTTQKPRSIILPRAPPPCHWRCTLTYAAPAYYTEAPKYYSALSYCTEAPVITPPTVEKYTEVPKYYSAPSYTTLNEAAKYLRSLNFLHNCCPFVLRWTEILHLSLSLLLLRRDLSTMSLHTMLRPTTPKLRSVTLLPVTTPLRHLNVTPRPTLLQLTTGRFLSIRAE